MGFHEEREEFKAELEDRLETAHLKDPEAMWEATVRPWWDLASKVLRRQGYVCEIAEDETGGRRMRVWNDSIGWSESNAAELSYAWNTAQVELTQRVDDAEQPVTHHSKLPVSRLTAEKVREHLRGFVKDIKEYVATFSKQP